MMTTGSVITGSYGDWGGPRDLTKMMAFLMANRAWGILIGVIGVGMWRRTGYLRFRYRIALEVRPYSLRWCWRCRKPLEPLRAMAGRRLCAACESAQVF
jgi:hypothetical protein